MDATFKLEDLITKMLGKIIYLEAKTDVLQSSVSALYQNRGIDYEEQVNRILPEHYKSVLMSYPEIDEALQKKLRDELGL